MSKPKHTPWPWDIIKHSNGVRIMFNKIPIADMSISSAGEYGIEYNIPNAHLIAAAPELLEASEALLKFLGESNGRLCKNLKKAITKAKGKN